MLVPILQLELMAELKEQLIDGAKTLMMHQKVDAAVEKFSAFCGILK